MISLLTVTSIVLSLAVDFSGGEHCVSVNNQLNCFFVPSGSISSRADGDEWDRAWQVCRDNWAHLPVIDSADVQKAVENYMKHHHAGQEVWAAGRGTRSWNWHWINGNILNDSKLLDNYGALSEVFDTQAIITYELKMSARYPGDRYNSLCHFTGSICQSADVIVYGDGCLKQVTNESLRWYEARNRCLDNGGDLPVFEDAEDVKTLEGYFAEMTTVSGIWIGLRKQWWHWKKQDSSEEVKYSNWLDHDNYFNRDCMILTENGKHWQQQFCFNKKKFFCHAVRSIHSVASAMNSNIKAAEPINPMLVAVGLTVPIVIIVAVASVVIARKWKSCIRGSAATSSSRPCQNLESKEKLQPPSVIVIGRCRDIQRHPQQLKLKPKKQQVEVQTKEKPGHDEVWVSRT